MVSTDQASKRNRYSITVALLFIRGYQLFISPILGPRCRFYPTCSHYTYQAIEQYGVLRGTVLGVRRLLRCHPGCDGGIDEVPHPSLPTHRTVKAR